MRLQSSDVGRMKAADPLRFTPTQTVEMFMRRTFCTVWSALPVETTVSLLCGEGARWALVVNEDDDLVGVVDRLDAEAAIECQGPEPVFEDEEDHSFIIESVCRAADVMQPYVQVVRPNASAARALHLMKSNGLDFIPVVTEGDTKAIGVVYRRDLERASTGETSSFATEPFGTFRDASKLPSATDADDRETLIDKVEHIARCWTVTRAVEADDPQALSFTQAILPVLSALYDRLVDHYSDLQEELFEEIAIHRPELDTRADRLRIRQGDALAVLSNVMQQVRYARRPDRSDLGRIEGLAEELREIEALESDLLYELHYVDVAAVD